MYLNSEALGSALNCIIVPLIFITEQVQRETRKGVNQKDVQPGGKFNGSIS